MKQPAFVLYVPSIVANRLSAQFAFSFCYLSDKSAFNMAAFSFAWAVFSAWAW